MRIIDLEAPKHKEVLLQKRANAYKRLQAVALRGEGKTNKEISKITGYNADCVRKLCKIYVNKGLEGLETKGRKGGNHCNMTEAEAAAFLQKYEERAKRGELITAEEIGRAYDEAVGKKHKSLSSI